MSSNSSFFNRNYYSLYIHVPFCSRKCDYCHFFVLPNKETFKQQFIDGIALEWQKQHINFSLQNYQLVSIYFGGGTPWLLGPERISSILNSISKVHPTLLEDKIEITLEANPEHITAEMVQLYASIGINRLSFGVQSFDDQVLTQLSRQHNKQKAIESVIIASKNGIENISIDLMYDIPNQTLPIWKDTLEIAVQLPIKHLSLYNLTFEPQTVFYKKRKQLQTLAPSPQISLEMYQMAIETLGKGGLKQYEISAFAKEKFLAIHNIGYWTGRPFLGLGPSAFSYWEGERFRNVPHLNKYCEQLILGKDGQIDFKEKLEHEAMQRELLAIHLRLKDGVLLREFENKNKKIIQSLKADIDRLIIQGFLELDEDENRLSLTNSGFLFYDHVASELI